MTKNKHVRVILTEEQAEKIYNFQRNTRLRINTTIKNLALRCIDLLGKKKPPPQHCVDSFDYERFILKEYGKSWVNEQLEQIKTETPLEFAISEMLWNDIWYARPGATAMMNQNERWSVGVWTGPDNDLLCIASALTNNEGERLLSPGGFNIKEALIKALQLAHEEHPDDRLRARAAYLLQELGYPELV